MSDGAMRQLYPEEMCAYERTQPDYVHSSVFKGLGNKIFEVYKLILKNSLRGDLERARRKKSEAQDAVRMIMFQLSFVECCEFLTKYEGKYVDKTEGSHIISHIIESGVMKREEENTTPMLSLIQRAIEKEKQKKAKWNA